MIELIATWLANHGMGAATAVAYARAIGLLITLLFCILAYYLVRRILMPALAYSVSRTASTLDDVLTDQKIVRYLSLMAPALVIYLMTPAVFTGYESTISFIQRAALILMIVFGLLVVRAFLSGVLNRYAQLDTTKEIPLTNFFQVLSLIIYIGVGLLILAIILDRSPLYLLSGLGAVMAILTIAFRDPLLGLMAGIQLTTNKLVARGDFIELPKYDASGEVLRVALTTVTIRNADQSITTVPTYDLISESFKNWRGIQDTGLRLVNRSVLIDVLSVAFCSPDLAARIAQLPGLNDAVKDVDGGEPNMTAGPAPTNLGLFRLYLAQYLRDLPQIEEDLTLMVRQGPVTADGLPLEIFAYTSVTDIVPYEALQAAIIEHILAIAAVFELKIFQNPREL